MGFAGSAVPAVPSSAEDGRPRGALSLLKERRFGNLPLVPKKRKGGLTLSEKKDPKKSPRETGGPVVQSGPTRGENRSRNQDGEWRKKRSDAGKPRD